MARAGRTSWWSILLAVALAVVAGCGGVGQAPRGAKGGGCYADHRCDEGLSCVVGVCVELELGGDGAAGVSDR